MDALTWLESTSVVQWMVGYLWAYPVLLTGHAIGLAVTVGVALLLDLRLLGLYPTLPLAALGRLLGLAWIGIVLNTVTGLLIFATQATMYVTNVPFLVKIVFVVLGGISLIATQRILRRDADRWESTGQVSSLGRRLALGSILFWTIAVATGRLIAYA